MPAVDAAGHTEPAIGVFASFADFLRVAFEVLGPLIPSAASTQILEVGAWKRAPLPEIIVSVLSVLIVFLIAAIGVPVGGRDGPARA